MKVSIIIPCYNQAKFLPDAIESALAQTHTDIEIIVVNDGSPDNTAEVCVRYQEVKLVSKVNGGLSSARNAGIKASKGDYILPLDADDRIHPSFVTKTLEVINTGADIVSTGLQTFGNENRKWITDVRQPEHQHFMQRNHINCCSLFRKEVWEKTGGYDEEMKLGFEDWDFWTRATKLGFKVQVIPDILFFYRKHSVSMFTAAQQRRMEIIEYMHRKYSPSKKLIDVVYVLGQGSQHNDMELRYSIRSLERYCTGYRRIYIIGCIPSWVREIYFQRLNDGPYKAINILNKITAACNIADITDEFLFINDDHFFTEETDIPSYPYYYNNDERNQILSRDFTDIYRQIVAETFYRFPNADYYDIHKPMRINKNTFLAMTLEIDFKDSVRGLLIKSIYSMYAGIKGIKAHDAILREAVDVDHIEKLSITAGVISITNEAINTDLKTWLNKKYPTPSKYERQNH